MCVDDYDAADLLLVHLFHRLAQRRVRRAGDRMAHRQFAQACVERILGAQAFHGATLHLQVDLVSRLLTPRKAKSRNGLERANNLMNAGLFNCRQKVSSAARCSVRVARSPSNAARGKHSPVAISKVVSVPHLAVRGRSPTTRPCLTI
ncbi:hypothetical protein D9M73_205240 [compost metagenome]